MRTIVHVDADPIWRTEIERETSGWPDVHYLAAAATGLDGLELCRRLKPSVVLLDPGLPDMDGFAVAERLSQSQPQPPQIFALTFRCDDVALHWFERGAFSALVWKTARYAEELRRALHAVSSGRHWFPFEAKARMHNLRSAPDAFFKILSDTELALLPRFGRGETDASIATANDIAETTVRWHRYRIMGKLGLHRSIDLMLWTHQKGFVPTLRPTPPCEAVL